MGGGAPTTAWKDEELVEIDGADNLPIEVGCAFITSGTFSNTLERFLLRLKSRMAVFVSRELGTAHTRADKAEDQLADARQAWAALVRELGISAVARELGVTAQAVAAGVKYIEGTLQAPSEVALKADATPILLGKVQRIA
jgi:hypothetical protein